MDLESILVKIEEKAAKTAPLGGKLKFDFGDNSYLHIDGTDGKNVVTTEDKEAKCTIHVSKDDLMAIVKGDMNPMMAMFSGKIKIKGDMTLATKLQSLVS